MALIREKDAEALRKLAAGLQNDVDLTLYTQRESPLVVPGVVPCESCEVTEQMVGELGTIIPKMRVNVLDLVKHRDEAEGAGINRVPTMVLGGAAQKRVRFLGFPGGYEFPTFVKSVLEAGGAPDGLPDDVRKQIADAVKTPIDIKVFVTPT